MNFRTMPLFLAATSLLCLGACQPQRPEAWTEASHGPDAAPDYELLFDDAVVHRIDIRIAPEIHQAMQQDLQRFDQSQQPPLPAPGPGGDQGPIAQADPIWVPVDLEFQGVPWLHVGMRYKGNSSLKTAVAAGVGKLAFRLNFDKFEDEFPSIHNQRFYGFKKMTFSNAFKDPSLIRDKIGADIFRRAGVPAARGAFARVYVDFGEGPVYFGLYTMIEDPSDAMLASQFGDPSGNLYKPEPQEGPDSGGATWQSFVEADYDKKTNEDEGYDDVHAVLDALHAPRDDEAAWREGLEAVFCVDCFLRWLAVNQAIENWDSYLCIPHNYYLYGDPADGGRLAWIPWDLNESLTHNTGHCEPAEVIYSLTLDEADESRPLVRYLLGDAEYRARFEDELAALVAEGGGFDLAWVHEKMDTYHDLVAPYAVGPDGESEPYTFLESAEAFEQSLDGAAETPLKTHATARYNMVRSFLGL